MSLVSCRNLFVSYEENVAVSDLSFEIKEQDYIFILGENGSGKSTLLKTILGLKAKKRGEIVLENLKRSEIGYLPQKVLIQKSFPASVFEVVLSGFVNSLKIFPFYNKKYKEKAEQILKFLNMEKFKNISFRKLSKGQQQKVLLARAICSSKKILFLDEPCSSLDPIFTKEFYFLIKRLNEEKKIAIVMVSHDVEAAIANAKKILHMNKKALFFGEVSKYLKSDVSKSFLKGGDKFDKGCC